MSSDVHSEMNLGRSFSKILRIRNFSHKQISEPYSQEQYLIFIRLRFSPYPNNEKEEIRNSDSAENKKEDDMNADPAPSRLFLFFSLEKVIHVDVYVHVPTVRILQRKNETLPKFQDSLFL